MSLVIAGAEYIEKVAFVRAATGVLELGGRGVAHTICCKVEMTPALSKMEANLESALESWRQVGGLKEWGETLPPHFPITSSEGIKETPVV